MNFWEYPVPPLWEGATAFILGGGPSLHDVDLSRVKNEKVIGINEAYTFGDWVDFTFIGNNKYYVRHKNALADYRGQIGCAGGKSYNDPNVLTVYKSNTICTMQRGRIGMANNSGIGAINLAMQLGVREIVLLGFDMGLKNGINWHKNNVTIQFQKKQITERYYETVRKTMCNRVVDIVYGAGIDVYNCTPQTSLDCFPVMTLDEYFDEKELDLMEEVE
jgi:hypothetical protein